VDHFHIFYFHFLEYTLMSDNPRVWCAVRIAVALVLLVGGCVLIWAAAEGRLATGSPGIDTVLGILGVASVLTSVYAMLRTRRKWKEETSVIFTLPVEKGNAPETMTTEESPPDSPEEQSVPAGNRLKMNPGLK